MSSDLPAARGPIRVLIVDDHPFFRGGITAWIDRQNGLMCCGCADSPKDSLAALENLRPDIMLLDLQLREGDGFDVLRALRAAGRATPVIVVSHKDENIFAERALQAGARGYVTKEEACDALLDAITAVLSGRIHVSDAVRRILGNPENLSDAAGPRERLRSLGNREMQVFELLGRGRSTKEIAFLMGLSPKTIETYRENLKHKLGLASGAELIRFAILQTGDETGGAL